MTQTNNRIGGLLAGLLSFTFAFGIGIYIGKQNISVYRAAFAATCGNSILESGETCDDGGTTADDGCSASCTIEDGYSCSECSPVQFTSFVSTSTTRKVMDVAALDSSRVIAVYENPNAQFGYAVVGSVSSDILTWGTPEFFNSNDSPSVAVDMIDTDKAIVAYADGSDGASLVAVIVNVSGTSITTIGTPKSVVDSFQEMKIMGVRAISTSKFVILYIDDTGTSGTAIVGSVDGSDNITLGSAQSIASGSEFAITDVDSTHVAIAYSDISNEGNAVIGTISDTSISFGSSYSFNAATTSGISIDLVPSTSKIAITYRDEGDSDKGIAVIGTISGTAISYGDDATFYTPTTNIVDTAVTGMDSTTVAVSFTDVNGSADDGYTMIGTVSGTDLSFTKQQLYTQDDSNIFGSAALSSTNFVTAYRKNEGSTATGLGVSGTTGFYCQSTCTANFTCGDGNVETGEECDDSDTDSGDGCSSSCDEETGFSCSGNPSTCTSTCGDGVIASDEGCDDSDTDSGDGCSSTCTVENGFSCSGTPSSCSSTCGDGVVASDEGCDDDNTNDEDGCSSTCTAETGFSCSGEPSSCSSTCGDGVIASDEGCDDSDTDSGDGCSSTCTVESGYSCSGTPSTCTPTTSICGDGIIASDEGCDDSNTTSGDGCSSSCSVESGFSCASTPSTCTTTCGDNIVAGSEECEPPNAGFCANNCLFKDTGGGSSASTQNNDGSSGGKSSTPVQSTPLDIDLCGNGEKNAGEECDFGQLNGVFSCSNECTISYCGDGKITPQIGEECEPIQEVNAQGVLEFVSIPSCGATVCVPPDAYAPASLQGQECRIVELPTCNTGDALLHSSASIEIARCGDGRKDDNEQCDFGVICYGGKYHNTFADDRAAALLCHSNGGVTFARSGDGCNSECELEFCGDRLLQANEQCDNGSVCSNDAARICQTDSDCLADGACIYNQDLNPLCTGTCALCEGHYEAQLNLHDFPVGEHTLKVQVMNVCGSSAVSETEFVSSNTAIKNDELPLAHSMNAQSVAGNPLHRSAMKPFDISVKVDKHTYDINADGTATISVIVTDEYGEYVRGLSPQSMTVALDGVVLRDLQLRETDEEGCSVTAPQPEYFCDAMCLADEPFPVCGDGIIEAWEGCDDGNLLTGDGCSNECSIENGFACDGAPSTCASTCGDGIVAHNEQCDDGNTDNEDGCSSECTFEEGYNCESEPSTCSAVCGDGLLTGAEQCDDGNTDNGDGCSSTCTVEIPVCGNDLCEVDERHTFDADSTLIAGSCPADCGQSGAFCGDGIISDDEVCDDANIASGDGCTADCQTENGFSCSGEPSTCGDFCGNGVISGSEQCDDGNENAGDGCSVECTVEEGYECAGDPSICEELDHGAAGSCSACETCGEGLLSTCTQSTCEALGPCSFKKGVIFNSCTADSVECRDELCGNGNIDSEEQCDDGNKDDGDGCSAVCEEEPVTCEDRFEVQQDGTIETTGLVDITFRALGSAITYGAGGPEISVFVHASTDGGDNWTELFNGEDIDGGESEVFSAVPSGSQLQLKFEGKFKSWYRWLFNKAFDSAGNNGHILILRDGDALPDKPAFDNQASIEEYVGDIIDDEGNISIGVYDVVLLAELGSTRGSSADFQDAVVLIEFNQQPGTCSDAGHPSAPEEEPQERMTICHGFGEGRSNKQTIEIASEAWSRHRRHNDTQGACSEPDRNGSNEREGQREGGLLNNREGNNNERIGERGREQEGENSFNTREEASIQNQCNECEQCGSGVFNRCTRRMCESIGACTYSGNFFRGSCAPDSSLCSDNREPQCGNGRTESGEVCDDGNTSNGDGCSRFCVVEPNFTCEGTPSNCSRARREGEGGFRFNLFSS